MPIHFSFERWEAIREAYRAWWAGELRRPLFHVRLDGLDPGRPEPVLPHYDFTSFYDLSVPAEQIVDRWDYSLSKLRFLGDAFPCIWPNFGAGVLAAFLGARVNNGSDTTWFHPPEEREVGDVPLAFDPANVWFRRILEVMRAAMDRWQGLVQVGMTDLGGNLDILSTFRPGKRLLLDLYDRPDDVKRQTWRVHEEWWRCFEEFNRVLQPRNPGYTAWTPIYSAEPYYMLQCDFCYMISPKMFDEFVKPELAASCRRLGNAFYHLDGPGELPHLDSLLEIEELKGVQWVPGAGNPDIDQWPEVYRKIRKAGKLIQIWHGKGQDGRWYIDVLADQLGSPDGIIVMGGGSIKEEDEVMEMLERYDAV